MQESELSALDSTLSQQLHEKLLSGLLTSEVGDIRIDYVPYAEGIRIIHYGNVIMLNPTALKAIITIAEKCGWMSDGGGE